MRSKEIASNLTKLDRTDHAVFNTTEGELVVRGTDLVNLGRDYLKLLEHAVVVVQNDARMNYVWGIGDLRRLLEELGVDLGEVE